MKTLLKPALAAGLMLVAAPVMVAPAAAQAVQNIGVVNLPAVVARSNAFTVAQQQRQVTYKPQFDQANARQAQLAAQINPMIDRLRTDSQAANPDNAALQAQATTVERLRQSGQRELQTILQPVALSEAYVEEQIRDQLALAIENVAKSRKLALMVSPDSVLYASETLNMNQDILAELNRLLPSAQIVPPAGWEPREIREQRAAAAAAQAQQPATQAPVTGGR
ncbi:OmpH family outer membrane protein [Altererythrobacter aquiaggeris]|uniref:OmpH family outer membrane protein n=1 Tax=Aestuarierythrobacter aquiaggeris TaxID=1898396 RepID=UPI003019714B